MANMHVAVARFMEEHAEAAARNGNYRSRLGSAEVKFLQDVWGPAFQYDFSGLQAEYPWKDYKGGDRFADFVYRKNGIRLLIEIDGFTTHAKEISPGDFDDHLNRQNDLVLSGWLILRFSANQIRKKPTVCQRQIMQAIGHWWTIIHSGAAEREVDVWAYRKLKITQLALRRKGSIRCDDLVNEFGLLRRTAHTWLRRLTEDGVLIPDRRSVRVVRYFLPGVEAHE